MKQELGVSDVGLAGSSWADLVVDLLRTLARQRSMIRVDTLQGRNLVAVRILLKKGRDIDILIEKSPGR